MAKLTHLQQLGMDLYFNNITPCEEFSNEREAEEKLRTMLEEKVGGEFDYWNFERNKIDIFQIMSELLSVTTSSLTRETFEPFAEFRDLGYGDTIEWHVENQDLYDVAVVATDNNNLLRQRLLDTRVPMQATELGVKIYEHFSNFMAGRINWVKMVDKVAKSMEHEMVSRVGKAFIDAYSAVEGDSELNISGTMVEDKLTELVAKVEGMGVGEVKIYGTKTALAKVPGIEGLAVGLNEKRQNGYVKMFNGVECVEIKNTYNKETKEWGVAADKLFIVPAGVKPIMVGFEGEGFVFEDKEGKRNDRQLEYLFTRRCSVGVVKAVNYGVYTITA
jgi:hypothetical protein